MSPLLQICAVIVTLAVAAIAVAVLRAVKSFGEATEEFRKTADVARASIAEIDVVTRQLREIATSVESAIQPFQRTARRVEDLGQQVESIGQRALRVTNAVLNQIESPVTQTVALMTGVRAGTQSLFSRLAGRIPGLKGHATSNGGYRHE